MRRESDETLDIVVAVGMPVTDVKAEVHLPWRDNKYFTAAHFTSSPDCNFFSISAFCTGSGPKASA